MNRRSFFSGLTAAMASLAWWRPKADGAIHHIADTSRPVAMADGCEFKQSSIDPHSGYERKNSIYWNGTRVESPLLTEETLVKCCGNGNGSGSVEMVVYTPQEIIFRKRFTMPLGYGAVSELHPDAAGEGMYFTTKPIEQPA